MCAVLLASCGGGGGGSAVHPVTTFRANIPGDSWMYDVAINFGQFGAYKGTMSEALTDDTYNGQATVRDTQTFNLALKTGPSTTTSYSEIALDGTLLAIMLSDVLYAVTSDTFFLGATIGPTTSANGVITVSTGETLTQSYTVVGQEEVQTAGGRFACWIVSQRVSYSTGASDNFVLWVAPETGNFVKITDTTNNGDGTGYTYTASLTSMVTAASARPTVSNTPLHLPNTAGLSGLFGHLRELR